MITRHEWLAALEEVKRPPKDQHTDALTKMELAKLLGLERSATHRWILKLIAAGLLRRTTKYMQRSDGRYYPSPAYLLVKEAAHAKTAVRPSHGRRARST